ncbi:hypothetical protein [Caballeronia sp. LZ032]|uniref:hypothetical protein n=1 Tax=Caballeronia sp. LZ032 TaxID=3038565 RepID=UPI00286B50FB|nr:hypothetical protein [Caballeronia sp. LZ032]
MPVTCTFILNNRSTSTLVCSGYGTVKAFSGNERGLDNPAEVASKGIGPIRLERITSLTVNQAAGWVNSVMFSRRSSGQRIEVMVHALESTVGR